MLETEESLPDGLGEERKKEISKRDDRKKNDANNQTNEWKDDILKERNMI